MTALRPHIVDLTDLADLEGLQASQSGLKYTRSRGLAYFSEVSGGENDQDSDGWDSQASQGRRQGRNTKRGKEPKKVGRPIAYQGDPNAPHLTEQERRRIKRRIANRESARRVRNKRQEALEGMQANIRALQQENTHMAKVARETDAQRAQLVSQMAELQGKLTSITQENHILRQEMQGLQQSLQVGQASDLDALDAALDKCDTEQELLPPSSVAPAPPLLSAFSSHAKLPLQDCQQDDNLLNKALELFPSLSLEPMPSCLGSLDFASAMLHQESEGMQAMQQA